MGNVPGGDEDALEHLMRTSRARRKRNAAAGGARTGQRVVMHGLLQAEMNGRFAMVLDPTPFNGRYHLRLEDTQREIRAKSDNFTAIVSTPSECIDVEQENSGAACLLGGCVICLGEHAATHAVVPCGHLAFCGTCAQHPTAKNGRCPVCRGPIADTVRIYLPSGNKDEELQKAIDRCREAEKRANDLETRLQVQQEPAKKRSRQEEGDRVDLGFWVRLPTLSALKQHAGLGSSPDVQYSRQHGEITGISETMYTVRFRCIDEEAYVAHGRKEPGATSVGVEFPVTLRFQNVYPPEEARRLKLADRCCIPTSTKVARKRKLRARREERSKDAD